MIRTHGLGLSAGLLGINSRNFEYTLCTSHYMSHGGLRGGVARGSLDTFWGLIFILKKMCLKSIKGTNPWHAPPGTASVFSTLEIWPALALLF